MATFLTAKLDAKHLESLWADLAHEDAAKAYQAAGTLIRRAELRDPGAESRERPGDVVTFLQQQLPPAPVSGDAQSISRLLADLDDDEFTVRENASNELAKLGEVALPALQKALAGPTFSGSEFSCGNSPGETLHVRTPDRLRVQRAVMVLEQIGSPEAKHLLDALSKGAERPAHGGSSCRQEENEPGE